MHATLTDAIVPASRAPLRATTTRRGLLRVHGRTSHPDQGRCTSTCRGQSVGLELDATLETIAAHGVPSTCDASGSTAATTRRSRMLSLGSRNARQFLRTSNRCRSGTTAGPLGKRIPQTSAASMSWPSRVAFAVPTLGDFRAHAGTTIARCAPQRGQSAADRVDRCGAVVVVAPVGRHRTRVRRCADNGASGVTIPPAARPRLRPQCSGR